MGPKKEHQYLAVPGTRLYAARDRYGRWILQRPYEVNLKNTGPDMLVRVRIGKIVDKQRLLDLLYALPVDEDDRTYRNRTWLLDGLAALRNAPGVMSEGSRLDALGVGKMIVGFAHRNISEGRFDGHPDMNRPKPCFDLMEGRYMYE